jgi:hypothetical protein
MDGDNAADLDKLIQSFGKYRMYLHISHLEALLDFDQSPVKIGLFLLGTVSGTFTCLKCSLVPLDFKECCIRY